MIIPVFYAPPENFVDEFIELPADESRHLAKVMRLGPAAIIIVVDGLGQACRAEVTKVGRDHVTARIHTQLRNFGEPVVRLTLAAGLSAGSKFDRVVEKGTELGVKRFVPVISEKSRVKLDEPRRVKSRVTRWEKVALAAMKQCRRSYRPEISTPATFEQYLTQLDGDDLNLIFHPSSYSKPLDQISINSDCRRVSVLVGPESGFSDDEVAMASDAGCVAVSLGQRILRTETAGPVVCALIMQALGEFR